jgi:hypothetical protein
VPIDDRRPSMYVFWFGRSDIETWQRLDSALSMSKSRLRHQTGAGPKPCPSAGGMELVEGHADPLTLSPDDVTRNTRAVRLKVKG